MGGSAGGDEESSFGDIGVGNMRGWFWIYTYIYMEVSTDERGGEGAK